MPGLANQHNEWVRLLRHVLDAGEALMPDRLIRSGRHFGRKALDTRHRAGRTTVDTRHQQQPGNSRTPDDCRPAWPHRYAADSSACAWTANDQASGRALINPVVQRTCHADANPDRAVDVPRPQAHVNAGGADVLLPVCVTLEQDLAERDEEVRR